MKKRIAFALCMILMVLMLGACGTDPTTVDYNGKSYSDLQSEMDTNAGMVQSLAQLFKENKLTADTLPDDVKDQLTSSYGVTEAQIEAAAKWQDTLDEFGEMKKIEDDTFEVTKSGKTLTTDMTIKFAKKDVNFEVVYDYYSMDVTGISVDPIYTLGEKMEKAGLNTVISMAVVFAVLILISLLIFGLTSRAETQGNQMHKYYTSILVIGDETLEDIAGQYADPDYYRNTAAYYREICEINHLPVKEGGIPHVAPGNYIIVPYFSPDFL